MDSLGQRDLPDLQGKMDFLDTLDREAKSVSKAKLDHLAHLELLAHTVPLVRLVRWVSEATLDLQDHLVSKAFLAPLVKKEPKEIPVLLVAPVKMDPLDLEDSQEREDYQELQVLED